MVWGISVRVFEEGELPGLPGQVELPSSSPVLNARKAQMLVLLRYHGPVVPSILAKQITTGFGGCIAGPPTGQPPPPDPDPAHLEKVRGAEHLDVAYPLRNLAAVRYAQRGYPEAEALLQRAISIQQKVLGPRHLASLTVCRSMQKCFASGSKRQRS